MLPWLVTGRLDAADRARIERHLAQCPACTAELALQRRLYEQFQRDDTVLLAPQAGLQKLMARLDESAALIDAPPIRARFEARTPRKRSEHRSRRKSRWLAMAAGMQAIVIVALLALVWQNQRAQWSAPRFTTLSSPLTESANDPQSRDANSGKSGPRENGAILRIVLQPHASHGQFQALVRSVNARVIDGPSEAGVYSLRLATAQEPQIAHALARVRADPNVVFAERADAQVRP